MIITGCSSPEHLKQDLGNPFIDQTKIRHEQLYQQNSDFNLDLGDSQNKTKLDQTNDQQESKQALIKTRSKR